MDLKSFLAIFLAGALCASTDHHADAEHMHSDHVHQHVGAEHIDEQPIEYLPQEVAEEYATWSHLEMFNLPAGAKGLTYSSKTQSLEGKKVAITGYMVRNTTPDPQRMMFADRPVVTMEHEYGIVDDVPPNVVHVFVPCGEGYGTAWIPAPFTVYGTLELGNRQEVDGRVSPARIQADYLTMGPDRVIIDICRPVHERDRDMKPEHAGHDH